MKIFKDYISEIEDFYRGNGVEIDPVPEVVVDRKQVDMYDPFIPTGHYEPGSSTIVLHVGGRHLKDILRSFCHELVHHSQNVTGMFSQDDDFNGSLTENERLNRIEEDAYMRGNTLFRKWTETYTK